MRGESERCVEECCEYGKREGKERKEPKQRMSVMEMEGKEKKKNGKKRFVCLKTT
jgi:hypothetical protein